MSPDLLVSAVGCTPDNAARYAPHLEAACKAYEINTPPRLAAFLAQIGHESGSFSTIVESLNYSVAALTATFGQHRITADEAYAMGRALGRPANQEAIANRVYGGDWGARNLGNVQPGDGWRYRGRGLIQTTGRTNYRAARDRLRRLLQDCPDFEAAPDLLADAKWAAWAAADYWDWRGLNALADAGDFAGITRRINGGLNGQDDRVARHARATRALSGTATKEEPTMPLPAIAQAALSVIVPNVPTLGKLFGSGSAVSERNLKAAEIALQVVQAATGSTNAQQAAERIASDPTAAQAAERAIREHWLEISESGAGGIDGAHKRSMEIAGSGAPLWHNPAFVVSMLLMLFPLMLAVDVFYVHPESYSGELRVQIVTAILAVIAMTGGYWIGTSFSSAKKDEQRQR